MQGLATADLVHGNREMSLYLVADQKFVQPKERSIL
jgi:hypothetical protein